MIKRTEAQRLRRNMLERTRYARLTLEQRESKKRKDRRSEANRVRPPMYTIWSSMISRCYNPNCNMFYMYGKRGIRVHPSWRGRGGYENFYADMGSRPTRRHSLERIHNMDGYGPDNCEWATAKKQARNTRANRVISFRGKTQCLAAWAEETGIDHTTLQKRLDQRGWSVWQTLTTMPVAGGHYA